MKEVKDIWKCYASHLAHDKKEAKPGSDKDNVCLDKENVDKNDLIDTLWKNCVIEVRKKISGHDSDKIRLFEAKKYMNERKKKMVSDR